jgi:hypothetical protein
MALVPPVSMNRSLVNPAAVFGGKIKGLGGYSTIKGDGGQMTWSIRTVALASYLSGY